MLAKYNRCRHNKQVILNREGAIVTGVETELNTAAHQAMQALEEKFIFRKLGICFDYASDPENFPRKTLPTFGETKQHKPNLTGEGTGIASCAANNALIFDGYMLRLELGIADQQEEMIFDRFVGGLIRIATTAPNAFIPSGLGPDGKSFYPQTDILTYVAWAFSLWRGYTTPTIAIESQAKLRNIASRWISRLRQDDFTIKAPVPEAKDIPLPPLCKTALLAVAADVIGGEWTGEYVSAIGENGLRPENSEAINSPESLLIKQLCLYLESRISENDSRKTVIQQMMTATATAAAEYLDNRKKVNESIMAEQPELDWRTAPMPPNRSLPAWIRIFHEKETIGSAITAAYVMMLTGEKDLLEPYAEKIAELLAETKWNDLILASAITPAIAVHAYGIELGLWDKKLLEREFSIDGTANLVDPYLTDDFDELNPDKAGHTEAPKRAEPEKNRRGNRKRRGNNRSGGNRNNNKNNEESGNSQRPPKRRRRKRKPSSN